MKELALRTESPPAPAPAPAPTGFTVTDLQVFAQNVARSRLFGLDEAQAFTLMLVAHSKGLHPIAAMERYHVIQGRPAMRADAMLAEFQRCGGRIMWTRHDNECCEATFESPGVGAPVTIVWTMADARKAGLGTRELWGKYPRQMLRARVISEGVRMVMPGIIAGIYSSEEVADFDPIPPSSKPQPLEHHATNLPNHTGHGRTGAYAKPETIAEYKQWLAAFVDGINAKWLDAHTSENGQLPPGFKDLLLTYQVSDHLLKWGREQGLIEAPAEPRSRQVDPLVAVLFDRHTAALETSAKHYARARWKEAKAALAPIEPEAESPEATVETETDDGDPDGELPPEPGMDG